MKLSEMKKIENVHYKVQQGVFFTGHKEIEGAILYWNGKITDYYWNLAGLINAKQPEELIKEAIKFFKNKKRQPTFYIVPWTKPKNFKEILQKTSFKLAYQDAWQVYDGPQKIDVPANLEIKEVKTKEDMQIFVDVFNKAFSGAPGDPYGALPKEYGETVFASFGKKFWKNYLVYCNGLPVATGGIAIDGECAGIYSIGTDPKFRKKGFGAAIVNFLTKVALENNCKFIFLQTLKGSTNEKFYNKLGFKTEFTGEGWFLE